MNPHVVIVPGWRNSGPDHWQSRWQADLPAVSRVCQRDWESPVRADWVEALASHIARIDAPVIVAAHSLGCITVAHLPEVVARRIAGALLVAPADIERPNAPEVLRAFGPIPRLRLPFASTVVASTNDPYCSLARATALAAGWGSELVVVGAAGHVNADSGLGDWPAGRRLLHALESIAA